jgi:hypothetical protein
VAAVGPEVAVGAAEWGTAGVALGMLAPHAVSNATLAANVDLMPILTAAACAAFQPQGIG